MIHTVGVADMKFSADTGDVIITHALGSCLGIVVYDPVARVGGLLHAMLPDSNIDRRKAVERPYMFIDTGLPRLFHECYRLGAEKSRVIVKVAGGATCKAAGVGDDRFQIGKRNLVTLRLLLWKNNVLVKGFDVGGNQSRTLSLEIGSGAVVLKSGGTARPI